MGGRSSLIDQLTHRARQAAATIASLLFECEEVLGDDHDDPNARAFDVDELMAELSKRRPSGTESPVLRYHRTLGEPINPEIASADERRVMALVLRAWAKHVRHGKAVRPDVLSLTCDWLASPNRPHLVGVVRFVVILALRSLYEVKFNQASLETLRAAYEHLHWRLEKQKRRRQLHSVGGHQNFMLDLLALDGWIQRRLREPHLQSWYESFEKYPFGVHKAKREFGKDDWPELTGSLPDFATLVNMAFNQPLALAGLDEVMGGLSPTIPQPTHPRSGGLVTLIAGPPGSGKTTLTLSITARMAELGSIVRYVATEEEPHGLENKQVSFASSLAVELDVDTETSEGSSLGDFKIVPGTSFTDLRSLVDQLERESAVHTGPSNTTTAKERGRPLYLPLPRVVVIDSLTALLHGKRPPGHRGEQPESTAGSELARSELVLVLNKLRSLGVCVFLVGGRADPDDEGLEYLVDNVLLLGTDAVTHQRHPVRTVCISKTRLQASNRGVHVLHLSRNEGVTVSPSLHAVLRGLKGRHVLDSDPSSRAVIWSRSATTGRQQLAFGFSNDSPLTIGAQSQSLVYGKGPAGKAALALALAFEPRVPQGKQGNKADKERWEQYLESHALQGVESHRISERALRETRVMVVSFLYGRDYYARLVEQLLTKRFHQRPADLGDYITTLDFYPGFIDAETLVRRVHTELWGGRISGRPYTAVVIDGVHNLLLQFPLLEREPLLWPTLFRLLRVEGIDTITTFTFFSVGRPSAPHVESSLDGTLHIDRGEGLSNVIGGSEHLFFQLLVGKCDYTFAVERVGRREQGVRPDSMHVRLESSIDGFGDARTEFYWDPETMSYDRKY